MSRAEIRLLRWLSPAGEEQTFGSSLAPGMGILKVAEFAGVGSGTVQRVKMVSGRLTPDRAGYRLTSSGFEL
jgi:hypothetical protein